MVSRMWQPGPRQQAGGSQLVMSAQQRRRPIQHPNAATGQRTQQVEARLAAIQRRKDIEPG
jgi:hypothetical protein